MREINEIIGKLKQKKPLLDKDYKLLLNYLQHEENEAEFKQTLANHWDEVCDDNNLVLTEPDDLFYKIYYKAQEVEKQSLPKKISIGQWIQRIAAIMLLPLLVVSAWYYYNDSVAASYIANKVLIEAPLDSKTHFFLPDGTQGWLQANSKLKFEFLENKQRSVNLEGDAYFDVARNEQQPFVVSTHDFKVRVLGTRFSVLADTDRPVSRVYLEEGSVEMIGINNERHTLLKPGEEYLFDKIEQKYVVNTGRVEENLAWTKGILLLKNKTLKDAVVELECFYNVDIDIIDKELEVMPVYAKIENERLEEVLEFTKLILPISYKIKNPVALDDGTFSRRKVVIRKTN